VPPQDLKQERGLADQYQARNLLPAAKGDAGYRRFRQVPADARARSTAERFRAFIAAERRHAVTT